MGCTADSVPTMGGEAAYQGHEYWGQACQEQAYLGGIPRHVYQAQAHQAPVYQAQTYQALAYQSLAYEAQAYQVYQAQGVFVTD